MKLSPVWNDTLIKSKSKIIRGSADKWNAFEFDQHKQLEVAKITITRWYSTAMDRGKSLLICGNPGCGKTHLARAIQQLMTSHNAIFVEEADLVKQIQATYGGDGSEYEIFSRYLNCELLIYDDLGAYETNNTQWINNIYRTIFEKRLRDNKPVLFTSNLGFVDADNSVFGCLEERLGLRNYDRLLRSIMVNDVPLYVNLFGVPSYKADGLEQYLKGRNE